MSKNFIIMFLALIMVPVFVFINMHTANQNGSSEQANDNEEQSEYLNFKALGGDAKIYLVGENEPEKLNLLFSYDKKTWFEFRLGKESDSGISVDSGKTVYICTTDENGAYPGQGGSSHWHFVMDVEGEMGEVRAGGNIMSLVNADFAKAKK